MAKHEIFALTCQGDLNNDSTTDCVAGGRAGVIYFNNFENFEDFQIQGKMSPITLLHLSWYLFKIKLLFSKQPPNIKCCNNVTSLSFAVGCQKKGIWGLTKDILGGNRTNVLLNRNRTLCSTPNCSFDLISIYNLNSIIQAINVF